MSDSVDFGKTAADYGRHRAGFPESFFERILSEGYVLKGDRVLDLGTGTGTIARGLAARGCSVLGLDPAEPLLEQARRLDAELLAGSAVSRPEYRIGRSEATGLADASREVVIAGQCWHWFDSPAAAAEAWRLLVPGGRLVLAYFDWLPLKDRAGQPNVVAATEGLIRAHNPAWRMHDGDGFHSEYLADFSQAGFRDLTSFSFEHSAIYNHESWRGRIRASAGVAATLPPEAVERFDRELGELLKRDFPENERGELPVPHRVWCACARKSS